MSKGPTQQQLYLIEFKKNRTSISDQAVRSSRLVIENRAIMTQQNPSVDPGKEWRSIGHLTER